MTLSPEDIWRFEHMLQAIGGVEECVVRKARTDRILEAVHEYYKVRKETVWDVAENKIPALKDWIRGILEKEGKNNG